MDESQDDSSEGSIVSYDSLESDDDDFSYSETSSSEESDNDMVDIPDDNSPEGVDRCTIKIFLGGRVVDGVGG